MSTNDRGRLRLIALLGLIAAGIGVTVVAGFVVADDQPSGEDVLSDVHEKYNTADSVSADAVVTVESDDGTAEFDVEAAAAGDASRLNVSDGDRYVLTGTTGEAVWISGPGELTGVIEQTGDDEATFSLRGGSEEPTGGLSAVAPGLGFDGETTVGELRDEFGEELPAEFDDAFENVSDDTTFEELPGEVDADELDGDLPDEFNESTLEELGDGFPDEFNESVFEELGDGFPGEFNESAIEEFEEKLPDEINESALEEFEEKLPDEINESALEEFEDELPDEINESALEDLGDELLAAVEDGEFDDVLPGELTEELPESVSEFEDEFEDEFEKSTEEFDETLPEGLDDLEEYESVEALTGDLEAVANETEVELVGTTTVDGVEAYELLVTHPDIEGETQLFTDVETDEILKQVTTTDDTTVTIDVTETRFDVSPADSTFEPRGATEFANATVETTQVETPSELDDSTPFAAVSVTDWTFERGAVTTTTGSLSVPGVSLPTESFETTVASAAYADDDRTLAVTQRSTPEQLNETALEELSSTDLESTIDADSEVETTVETIDDREVVLTTTPDGSAAAWIEDGTVVTVAGELDRDELESVIAAVEVGVDG